MRAASVPSADVRVGAFMTSFSTYRGYVCLALLLLATHAAMGQDALQEPPPCSQTSKSYTEERCLNDLANYYWDKGKHDDEVMILKRLLSIQERKPGPGGLDLATTLRRLGYAYISAGRYSEAQPVLSRALGIQEKALGQYDREVSNTLRLLGQAYLYERRNAEAEDSFARALTIRQKALPPRNPGYPDVAESFDDLGVLYESEGKLSEAEGSFEHSLAVREKSLTPDNYLIARSLDYAARVYTSEKKYREAEPLFQRALKILEQSTEPNTAVDVLQDYAKLLAETNRTSEAQSLRTRAQAILERNPR